MGEPYDRRLLLVTDEPDLALVLRRLLEAEGYEVEACPENAQAFVRYQMDPRPAVLFDPGVAGEMSAHALCHAIRELSPHVVLIGVGRRPASQEDEEVLRLVGADALLRSSFTVNQLLGVLEEAAELRAVRGKAASLVSCPACAASHRVRADALARRQWRAQCPNCNNLFRMDPERAMRVGPRVVDAASPRGRILVVDDTRFFRLFLHGVLWDSGFRVVLAEDGRQGLELARRWRPDVAVVDVTMPGLDGLEVLRRIKSEPDADRPAVLMLTSFDVPEYRRAAEEAGADGYLLKPIAVEAFVAEVSRLAARRGQACESAAA
jgi:predicted Zn finger-like uncharacterized protein